MGAVIAVLFIAWPVIEILVAVWVASAIGWLWMFALLVLGFVLGILVMRWAGSSAMQSLRQAATTGGRMPAGRVGDSGLVFLGGLLLAFPGFLTDVIGLLLILPPTRALIRLTGGLWIGRRLAARGLSIIRVTGTDGAAQTRVVRGDVIPGQVVDDQPPPGSPSSRPPQRPDDGTPPSLGR
ncbi:MAG: FxsA family protein [Actinomycetota bacterium]|nr:MAG: FxsA family protein [Actinomycetota bacterium]